MFYIMYYTWKGSRERKRHNGGCEHFELAENDLFPAATSTCVCVDPSEGDKGLGSVELLGLSTPLHSLLSPTGIVCWEESYQRICTRLGLPTVPSAPSCFAAGILLAGAKSMHKSDIVNPFLSSCALLKDWDSQDFNYFLFLTLKYYSEICKYLWDMRIPAHLAKGELPHVAKWIRSFLFLIVIEKSTVNMWLSYGGHLHLYVLFKSSSWGYQAKGTNCRKSLHQANSLLHTPCKMACFCKLNQQGGWVVSTSVSSQSPK